LLAIPVYIFLARGLRNGRVRDYALAGFFLAFAQYFSQLSRVAILVAAFLILDEIITRRARPQNWRRGLISGGLVALLVLAPLLFFVFKQPEVFIARTNQVAIWTDDFSFGKYPAQLLWENILAYAGMFNLSGDPHGNRVLPARPEADPFFAGLFIVGLMVALSRWRDQPARRVLVWYGLALVPGLVTLEAPAPTRVLEALSPMLVLAGWGAIQLGELIPVSLGSSRTLIRRGLLATICIAALVLNTTRYFSDTATDVRLLRSNQLISSAVGRTLSEWRAEGRIRAGASVYAPASLLTPDDRDALELLTGHSLTITPLTEASSPLPEQTVLVRPNNAGLANLLAQRDPRYRADASQALDKDQRDWLAIQTLMGARPFVQVEGPPFPGSGEPAFWLYTISQGP
ncbi:MAG TPA: hypothetical protein VIX58_11935, partial [Anaerolineae bacterium]